jgi:hypothetical protein
MKRSSGLCILAGLIWFSVTPAGLEAATLAGQPVQGGKSVEIRFPVAKYFQDMAAQSGNPRVETGRAVVTFPPGFDPARPWPILIVTSTTDFNRTSPMDAEWYRPAADAEGWMILASDATVKARVDSTPWRLAMLAAALEVAGRICGVLWGREAELHPKRDDGQVGSGQHLRSLSQRDQRGPIDSRLQDLPARPEFS